MCTKIPKNVWMFLMEAPLDVSILRSEEGEVRTTGFCFQSLALSDACWVHFSSPQEIIRTSSNFEVVLHQPLRSLAKPQSEIWTFQEENYANVDLKMLKILCEGHFIFILLVHSSQLLIYQVKFGPLYKIIFCICPHAVCLLE